MSSRSRVRGRCLADPENACAIIRHGSHEPDFEDSENLPMSAVGSLHDSLVMTRRVEVLASWFARLAPKNARILDVGCGDGLLSAALGSKRPDLTLRGIDVLPRDRTHIPVEMFDGTRIPFDDASYDSVLFSDVLHHTNDPSVLDRKSVV